ncbi:translation initiation factor sui1 [Colletotrichum karsti]|uniref:Translation initiation factor sui1 n=1 Tax=Colletotrichum karsti TaxID=1095194 RepID=A0A9P6LLE6_9PEZI|nr:translation initiation factor sui1 [Colletotrichum karsti]KAF9876497.1 translation initiation factor sui1 [Colletotrichum karsti]
MTTIENLKTIDPFADAEEGEGINNQKKGQDYIHIRIQQRNGRKTLTTIQGLPKRFDQKKILKVIKKKFACNGTIVEDMDLGEVIQLQGDQRKNIHDFLIDKQEGLEMDSKAVTARRRRLPLAADRIPASPSRCEYLPGMFLFATSGLVKKAQDIVWNVRAVRKVEFRDTAES